MTENEIWYFIQEGDSESVRKQLLENPSLSLKSKRFPNLTWDKNVELEAIKLLGAYLGSMTPLHLSIFLGHDSIAKDIICRTNSEDLNTTFGGGNTALHLATFLGARDVVQLLLERGAMKNIVNSKGFTSLDLVDDQEMTSIYEKL